MLVLLEHIFLGIVQGLTEFLPISSTGHLVLFRMLFDMQEAGLLFDTMLHFGTLIAVVIVFWSEVRHVLLNPTGKLARLLFVGTIPTAAIGLLFEDFFEEISRTGLTIGWEFLATGAILWAVESMRRGTRTFEQITYADALIIGTLQGAAILPAISRSGLTIAGSLMRGIARADAARFSFLLSLPAILGASGLQTVKLIKTPLETIDLIPMIVGTGFAAIAGYVAIRWMLKIISNGSMKGFAVYVWILGAVILAMQFMGH
ncbi:MULTISPECIES: undecaprenyl-diphosphate phosphatase [Brevibacillus]|jgi:undecaprenyl-diphosphatase|uniref:Undecaprenyl-diphosphatase n=1 Tax=Brevibacillus borstelensis AK1 TaxID=1300222 RepID=M8E5B8_9BACL|nr:undecaprenyl-diphosphate phosphatase [Brevibacillus borstelensis]EMT50650.1 undecaprenyl pyrophosphate phosphatase [Brevibacillus borstelensis AK1]KKX56326.1 UDP pyrophosphate phosphatase [Brevibacillus borstelensis cifa_chp40]MBE5395500.1 undecaprenyl-diphosphate phosphatase [Brevibacillus borstelensis]MCC0564571.1 undecaprenyl-diphosphate phosphatase [Brevibacillus borstelensis]MCM3470483.1 undecaprenyl-diphosphate phosphatase [Brevibacillus borstelensis]